MRIMANMKRALFTVFIFSLARISLADSPWYGLQPGIESDDTGCPKKEYIVYSPFRPYFTFYVVPNKLTDEQCWPCMICLLEQADEARKLQFASTALIMGLIPLVLKDIAWPERRKLFVTHQPSWTTEIYMRMVGLEPWPTKSLHLTRQWAQTSSRAIRWSLAWKRSTAIILATLTTILFAIAYAAIATMEIFSKRSVIGCTAPITILAWYILAVVPAALHAAFHRRRIKNETSSTHAAFELTTAPTIPPNVDHLQNFRRPGNSAERPSSIQGSEELWPVQFFWAVYYIAGTLVWTSIAAVTVLELAVWLLLAFIVTGTGKLSALYWIVVFEKTG